MTQASVHRLARNGVSAVIDGAYTDNTGVAFAVAAGSTEVVAYLDGNSEEDALRDLVHLFTDAYTIEGVAQLANASAVFEEKAADGLAECLKFARLEPVATAKHLKSISFGTLTATTAATASKLWGIVEGTSVSLRVVAVAAGDATSGQVDAHNFDEIVQDVMDSITSNSGLVR